MDKPLNCVFAGTPAFAVPALQHLLASPVRVSAVYTQPDRPAGRGRKNKPSPVKEQALEAGVPVYQPLSLREADAQAELAALEPDLMVVVAYGLILPQQVLDTPRLGCVNIHASLLPRWRGAAPIQRAILAGDSETGISIMRMEAGLDTGPVLARRSCPIKAEDTAGDLHDRLASMGAELLLETLPAYAAGAIEPAPQDDAAACYAAKLSKQEAHIDWNQPAQALGRQVRAFNPWPVAQAQLEGENVRVWQAQPVAAPASAPPGEIIAVTREGIDVATGEGALRLQRLQTAGSRTLTAREFLNGRPLRIGQHFQ